MDVTQKKGTMQCNIFWFFGKKYQSISHSISVNGGNHFEKMYFFLVIFYKIGGHCCRVFLTKIVRFFFSPRIVQKMVCNLGNLDEEKTGFSTNILVIQSKKSSDYYNLHFVLKKSDNLRVRVNNGTSENSYFILNFNLKCLRAYQKRFFW